MAFRNKDFSVIAYANGFTMWHYSGVQETIVEICAPNYFANVKTLCNTGDIVIINASDGTAIKTMVTDATSIKLANLAK